MSRQKHGLRSPLDQVSASPAPSSRGTGLPLRSSVSVSPACRMRLNHGGPQAGVRTDDAGVSGRTKQVLSECVSLEKAGMRGTCVKVPVSDV